MHQVRAVAHVGMHIERIGCLRAQAADAFGVASVRVIQAQKVLRAPS